MKIILASNSPRRKDLMNQAGLDFSVVVSEIDENKIENEILNNTSSINYYKKAELLTNTLSYKKAKNVLEMLSPPDDTIIIGADTVVVCDEKILGKPKDKEDAYITLVSLCGKKHRVYTSVCLLSNKFKKIITSFSDVEFFELDNATDEIIKKYISSGLPLDKAGSYGIQDFGSLLVKKIDGDYYTIVGFPISEVYRTIMNFKKDCKKIKGSEQNE